MELELGRLVRVGRIGGPPERWFFPLGLMLDWYEHYVPELNRTLAHVNCGECWYCKGVRGLRRSAAGYALPAPDSLSPARIVIVTGNCIDQIAAQGNVGQPFTARFEREGRDKVRPCHVRDFVGWKRAIVRGNRDEWLAAIFKRLAPLLYPLPPGYDDEMWGSVFQRIYETP
jgi:hypothetical protein